ncbi:hypothetical protein JW905_01830, partial [bacterium]|nr:hypothetical protein [candidate division CSSED10-310 bacterium]
GQEDGSMPQHSRVDGFLEPDQNEQLDETAAPLLLAWRLWRQEGVLDAEELAGLYPEFLKPAADFLVATSPTLSQDRWEEEWGWSPAAMAAVIGACTCAAEIADEVGDTTAAAAYQAYADQVEVMVESRTFTTSGGLGDGRYYVRVDQTGDPDDNATIEINSGGGVHREKDIIALDFLELVKLGIRSPLDAHVTGSLPEVDANLRIELPGGACFHRYSFDGYGEKSDGRTYLADPPFTGIGRAWPVLTGERGHFEVAAGGDAGAFAATMESFATPGRLLPEQVWDEDDLPAMGLIRGAATNAACPLSWSGAEYLCLLRSMRDGVIFGRIDPAFARYANLPPIISSAVASPARVPNDGTGTCLLLVAADDPDGRVVEVAVGLAALGLDELPLNDDGVAGDEEPDDGIWSGRLTVTAGTAEGDYLLACTAVDDAGAAATADINLHIGPPNAPPVILFGGYMNTNISIPYGGAWLIHAYVLDPNGQNDIMTVDVTYDRVPTGMVLLDDGHSMDGAAGDGFYGLRVPISGPLPNLAPLLFEIRAVDASGAEAWWPHLVTE